MIGINVGSGQRRFKLASGWRWINVDAVSRPPDQVPDLICDVGAEPLPWADGFADCVVLHHVLEHFGCGEALPMLHECWRVVCPGGSIIVTVPDMRALAARFVTNELNEFLFMVNTYGAYQGMDGDRHKWGYTRETLKLTLGELAGGEVIDFSYRDIPGADIARDWWILGMEVIKR